MSFLHSLSDKNIYDLGIALGISHQHLTDANRGASFLGNVILDWLNRVDKVGKPSWRSLVSALRDPMVKQTGIANDIAAKKHKTWTSLLHTMILSMYVHSLLSYNTPQLEQKIKLPICPVYMTVLHLSCRLLVSALLYS